MEVFNYHPWTMIYLNLPPSIGVVGNWNQWSQDETNLIKKAKGVAPQAKITILNFLIPKMKIPIVSTPGVISLGEKDGVNRLINYSVPNLPPGSSRTLEINGFESLKGMMHINQIFILANHPLLQKLKRIYQPSRLTIVKPSNNRAFLNKIKRYLRQGELENYRHLVGANYSFRGPVSHGSSKGVKIGYPTVNLRTKPPLPIRSGVYLVQVSLPNENKKRWGLGDYRQLKNRDWVFETYILDFNQQIYDWVIEVELVTFHRDNVPFENVAQMHDLIQQDEVILRQKIRELEKE